MNNNMELLKRKEEPVLAIWSERGDKAVDDLHTQFAWSIRRLYRQPNTCPDDYWSRAKYLSQVVPNVFQIKDDLMFLSPAVKNKLRGHDSARGDQLLENHSKWRGKFLCPEQ